VYLFALFLCLAPLGRHAWAHTTLSWSRPADGDVVDAPLREVRFRFSDPVVVQFTRATLVGADGQRVATPELALDPESNRREFFLTLDQRLPGGDYTVRWRTVAADGHAIDGSFRFMLEAAAEEPSVAPSPPAEADRPVHHPEVAETVPALAADAPLSIAIRFLHYLSLLSLLGAVAFHFAVIGRIAREPRAAGMAPMARHRNWLVATSALVLLALVAIGPCGPRLPDCMSPATPGPGITYRPFFWLPPGAMRGCSRLRRSCCC
jgi:copper resistance protein C